MSRLLEIGLHLYGRRMYEVLIGGPTLAARAFETGLVDEVHLGYRSTQPKP